MIFGMGSSCFSHSPLHHSLFPYSSSSSSSSSQYSSHSVFLCSLPRNGGFNRKNRQSAMACVHRGNLTDNVFCKRRAILLVGISVLPFLPLKAKALQGLTAEEPELRTAEQKQKTERLQGNASSNSFVSFLNGFGIFSSGVLGALYALARKEKTAAEAIIESMTNKLNEKEAAIASLEKNFESKLLKEKEERNKQLKKANEERLSLMNQLNLANSTITRLGRELQSEKRSVEDLIVQIDNLQTHLTKAGESKKELEEKLEEKLNSIEGLQERIALLSSETKDKEDTLHNLNSTLAAKESDLRKLNSTYEQTKVELAGATSEIEGLKQELVENQKELELRDGAVHDLNAQMSSLIVQRDDSNKRLDAIQKEYDDLKSISEEKAAVDAKLLGERDYELHQLKEKMDFALNEASRNQQLVADLTQERDHLKKMLDSELNNVKHLKHELQITNDTLGNSRNEVSDLVTQLQQSRSLCSDLEAEVSRVQAEFAEARESFHSSLEEAKHSTEVLAGELKSAEEVLKNTEDKLQIVSHELAAAAENRDGLKKELVDVYTKAEGATHELMEEKKVVASLKKELQALEKQMLNDKESRRSLETDLEEATKSLDEMNEKALLLSRDLEMARLQIANLESEKDVLYKSLAERTQVSQEARENMEDAHHLVMRLGKERESLEKKAKKLEEELASAKGEILRLRSRINSSRALVNDQNQNVGGGNSATVPAKKNISRRRKARPQQDSS